MALLKPWRYLVPKPPNLDVAKEARILCDASMLNYLSWENLPKPIFRKGNGSVSAGPSDRQKNIAGLMEYVF